MFSSAPRPIPGSPSGLGGRFGSARVFPSRAEEPEGCSEAFGYFRIHSGASASLGYFRLHSGSRRRGRRSALPAALVGKYRRKLRVTPSWRRKPSKPVTAASRTHPGRAEAARGGVSGVSGAARKWPRAGGGRHVGSRGALRRRRREAAAAAAGPGRADPARSPCSSPGPPNAAGLAPPRSLSSPASPSPSPHTACRGFPLSR